MTSTAISSLPLRNRGTYLEKCSKVSLTANLFKVNYKQETKIYIYTVKTLPEIPMENGKKLRSMLMTNRHLIQRLLGQYIISGRAIFGTMFQPLGKNEQVNIRVNFEGSNYQIFFKKVKEVSMSDIKQADKQKSGVVFAFLNNMIRNFFHQLQYSEIGKSRKYFDPNNRINLQAANVTIFKGFSSSFSMLEGGLYLKIDPVMKIIRSETVLQVINKVYKINSSLSKGQKRALVQGQLLGKCVMANYGKNKYYIIESILFDKSIEDYQFLHHNKNTKLHEYYKETYDISIQSKKQPLVRAALNQKSKQDKEDSCNPKKEIILVPELLLMSGLPDDFDERKRMEISQATIVKPGDKLGQVENLFNQFNKSKNQQFNPQIIANKLGISIQKTPSKISAKQLNLPELQLGGRERIQQNKVSSFQLFNKNLFDCDTFMNVAVFYPSDFDFNSTVTSIFNSTCKNLGLKYKFSTYQINYRETKAAMSSIQSNVFKESKGETNIFWFILPSSFKAQYKNLKRYTLKAGIEKNSQVSLTTTLLKKNSTSIITKILLQMAAKVGNRLWVPKINPRIQSAGIMLVGIQKVADSEDKNRNVISFCSNTNKNFSSFYSNYIYQNKNELKTNITQIIFECLEEYLIKNSSPPSNIILLKNGSAEFDQKISIQTEVNQIKEVLSGLGKSNDKTSLMYIIIDKDVSLKLFNKRGNDIANPSSGTLINSEAVGNGFEFYLVAQQCNRGTVKPTFYKVIYSDSILEEGLVQDLLFTQCFNYMNWSGSIKVPNIMQYAKKLGMFVGQYINNESSITDLSKNLYYI